jgi:hypothetical protein
VLHVAAVVLSVLRVTEEATYTCRPRELLRQNSQRQKSTNGTRSSAAEEHHVTTTITTTTTTTTYTCTSLHRRQNTM